GGRFGRQGRAGDRRGQEHRPRHRAALGPRRRRGRGQRALRPRRRRGGRGRDRRHGWPGGRAPRRRLRSARGRADGGERGGDAGRHRHRRVQRRAAAPNAVPRHAAGGVAGDPVGGARWRVHPVASGRAAHDPPRRRRHRRAFRHLDPCGHAQPRPRIRFKGGPRRPHAGARGRVGAARHPLQLRVAGRHRHRTRRLGRPTAGDAWRRGRAAAAQGIDRRDRRRGRPSGRPGRRLRHRADHTRERRGLPDV
ncbi:MAG: 3-oxoacyl-[acyl-carrier protein] reductase, partial [uncultured Acetobacteraceae bacterium]